MCCMSISGVAAEPEKSSNSFKRYLWGIAIPFLASLEGQVKHYLTACGYEGNPKVLSSRADEIHQPRKAV